jgi:hypothetical protein
VTPDQVHHSGFLATGFLLPAAPGCLLPVSAVYHLLHYISQGSFRQLLVIILLKINPNLTLSQRPLLAIPLAKAQRRKGRQEEEKGFCM